jgi:NAD(P)-dependent dehydrogenase (short-subunit alcohol dehydrogenase family)
MRLAGKAGIVTGGAGGIGSAAALAFAAEGATVGLLDRDPAALQAVADKLGGRGIVLPADVTDEDSVRAAVARWRRDFGHADFAYVCAGQQLHGQDGPAGDVSLDVWNRTMAVNLTGAFLTVKHVIPLLAAAPAGSLIMCGSPTGLTMAGRGYAAYAASKAGMMSLARTVAADYAPVGIRANVIVPGTTQTPLISALLDDDATREALLSGTPLGRLGTSEDLAGIAVYLASDESRYATAATFCVDGGLTQR